MGVKALADLFGRNWPAIEKAGLDADVQLSCLNEVIRAKYVDSSDISVVVFGSLARREWTTGSDLDWTLVIDGEANHEHGNTAHQLTASLKAADFGEPGQTKTFGTLTFSHDLIHQIGGMDDTNRNTTQRLLLLLESRPANQPDAYHRVVRGILRRYLENDYRDFRLKIPRFLLNDLHRYWRTICVDYASKYREQDAHKWGIRNAKLRISRKLIFAAGLLSCYRCDPAWVGDENPQLLAKIDVDGLVKFLENLVGQTPLDILAAVVAKLGDAETADLIFGSYNTFLEKLDDATIRKHLEDLKPENSKTDAIFGEMMKLSDSFENGLEKLFFDNDRIRPLTRKYGVFDVAKDWVFDGSSRVQRLGVVCTCSLDRGISVVESARKIRNFVLCWPRLSGCRWMIYRTSLSMRPAVWRP